VLWSFGIVSCFGFRISDFMRSIFLRSLIGITGNVKEYNLRKTAFRIDRIYSTQRLTGSALNTGKPIDKGLILDKTDRQPRA
jgi:hypothetical protein